MATLTADRPLETYPTGRNVYDILTTAIIFSGGLVGLSVSTGELIRWDNTSTDDFIGIALAAANGATATPAGTDTTCAVNDEGMIIKHIPIASAAQTSVGLEVHCTTDNILVDACLDGGTTSRAVGRIIRFRTAADCDVEIYSATTWHARYIQSTT